ncbi:chloride channel protein [Bosea sp. 685]|uniref:chloride channel protein n=1 Tax=Bosea sp. 685 TaxID=3080057 RepID=UPI002892AAE6|nr:chloride channel protein [Bosea sp. 685]WNJ89455.1 chloride channel protein [Bosea sp. 685]
MTSVADTLSARTASRTRPQRLRRNGRAAYLRFRRNLPRLLRSDDISLVLLAALIGVGAGLLVTAMVGVSKALHAAFFATRHGEVSGAVFVDPLRAVGMPVLGGLVMGAIGLLLARRGRGTVVDPVEANALHGGRLSLKDSLILVVQTMVSNGFGASVGMEAGYTQGGAAFASGLGRLLRVRRADLRMLVGCGTAGAIAAAFDAPLTGAFYAFELIIVTYTVGSLAPVVVASICAVGVTRLFLTPVTLQFGFSGPLSGSDYVLVMIMGILCAGLGIVLMRGVALAESLFRRSRIPLALRPAVGGLLVGLMALVTPAVLSSGHSALHVGFDAYYPAGFLVLVIVLKSLASAISIGSGFRGGLFFASLFIGAMFGKLVAVIWITGFGLQTPSVVIAVIGMSAMATAVVGGPLTMSFLALETTGSLPLTVAVLAASVLSSMTVRRTFGYSFATWRFHLRGETIRSAADIGWMRELSVGRMMRRDVRTVPATLTLEQFRRDFPLGANQRAVLVDELGRYAGIVLVADAYGADAHGADVAVEAIAELARNRKDVLLPHMNIREAASLFATSQTEELVVVDGRESLRVLGLLTEQFALRRYNAELDRQSRDLTGI